MLVDVTEDGAILLRQAGVYPIEIYSEERIREFERADRLTAPEAEVPQTITRAPVGGCKCAVQRGRNPDGRAAAILALAERSLCELLTSPHAVEEARRNLNLKHPDRAARLEEILRAVDTGREVSLQGVARALAEILPPKDSPILAAAVDAQADLLVTGDLTHFGNLYGKTIRGVKVVTPAMALAGVFGRR